MPHDHHDNCCSHGDHDHNLNDDDVGPNDNLFPYIDRPNVVALNATTQGSYLIKPWHERRNEDVFVESDTDEQLIIRVPFNGSVKLRMLLLKTGPGDQTAEKVLLYANAPSLDFGDVQDSTPTQEFEVAVSPDVCEYPVKAAKFSSLSSVSIFIPSNRGADTTKLFYIGFLGHWSQRKENPVITVYEAQANLADHEKIQGTEGNFSTTQS
ncbi:galactose-binding domain-like protein [Pisolithus orientalis]|uniref:galactose-binding domain-like protein n=1 Tax=Pisolithus orientalis TaxID=936130 RepID=UPI00222538EB|nr:galactose-binding domain-like protein [Pisolithus orientalis]KAI6025812.1 galactose-binding domain-like protein [Pisolithus orientalis]